MAPGPHDLLHRDREEVVRRAVGGTAASGLNVSRRLRVNVAAVTGASAGSFSSGRLRRNCWPLVRWACSM